MLNAEQMFLKLGFVKKEATGDFIRYEKVTSNVVYVILFDFDMKSFNYMTSRINPVTTDMEVLKAIIKQCEELGWLVH